MSCLICLDPLADEICTLTCCQVKLHSRCWLKWASIFSKQTCPNCRANTKCYCTTHNQQILIDLIQESQREINELVQQIRTLEDENLAIRMRNQSEAIHQMFEQFNL